MSKPKKRAVNRSAFVWMYDGLGEVAYGRNAGPAKEATYAKPFRTAEAAAREAWRWVDSDTAARVFRLVPVKKIEPKEKP